jgi:hypothetical protein
MPAYGSACWSPGLGPWQAQKSCSRKLPSLAHIRLPPEHLPYYSNWYKMCLASKVRPGPASAFGSAPLYSHWLSRRAFFDVLCLVRRFEFVLERECELAEFTQLDMLLRGSYRKWGSK